MKNYVKFGVKKSYHAILVSRPQYIEIRVERHLQALRQYSIQDMCNTVKETMVKSMRTVISTMKCRPFLSPPTTVNVKPPFQQAFTCHCEEDCGSHHLIIVHEPEHGTRGEYFGECSRSGMHLALSDKQRIWFEQVSKINIPVHLHQCSSIIS